MPDLPRVGALGIFSGKGRLGSCCRKLPLAGCTVGCGGVNPPIILLPEGDNMGCSDPGPLRGVRGDMVLDEAPVVLSVARLLSDWSRWCAMPLGAVEPDRKLEPVAGEGKGGLTNDAEEPLLGPMRPLMPFP